MVDQELINRINELAKIAKERPLTVEEEKERENLRNEYRRQFRAGFTQIMENTKVIDEKGNEIDLKKQKH